MTSMRMMLRFGRLPAGTSRVMRIRSFHQQKVSSMESEYVSPNAKQFPASFVVPTAMPDMSQRTAEEAEHRKNILGILQGMNLPMMQYAFAYGSGVFSQAPLSRRDGGAPPMIDMVVAVKDPVHWHAANMLRNKSHYPWWTRWFGLWAIRAAQKMGAGLWYIPYVKVHGEIVKYGVISIEDLCKDLLYWNTLYVGGRMHKPIACLFDATNNRVPNAQQANLTSALRASLLLLPASFSEMELYRMLASLSYMGDFRMKVPGGENRNKVENIVKHQLPWFRIMYSTLLTRLRFVHVNRSEESFIMHQDKRPATLALVAINLPQNLRLRLVQHFQQQPHLHPVFQKCKNMDPEELNPATSANIRKLRDDPGMRKKLFEDDDCEEADAWPYSTRFWLAVVQQPSFEDALREQITQIVSEPARIQSLKGLYTAGIGRSLRYLWSKMNKYRQTRKRAYESGDKNKGIHSH